MWYRGDQLPKGDQVIALSGLLIIVGGCFILAAAHEQTEWARYLLATWGFITVLFGMAVFSMGLG
jgi:hypothetical protein